MQILLLVGIGCTHSGLGRTTSTGDTATTTAASDCPWVGTWKLDGVKCSTIEYAEWFETYDGAEMEISQDPEGGCAVETTLTGPECERVESWHLAPPLGVDVEITFGGITDCSPNRCTFDDGAIECKKGDLARDKPESIRLDQTGEKLAATGLLEDTAGGCMIGLNTTWEK
jgi:hypothetical protein